MINVFVPAKGAAEVRSCELAGNKWRNRTSFTTARKVEDVFLPGISEGLYLLLGKITAKTRVLSLPDQMIGAQGIVMGGIQLVTNFAEDGSAVVIMRFKHIVGGIQNAFISAFGLSEPVAEVRNDLALDVLADISLPLLDLCNYAETGALPTEHKDHPLFRRLALRAGEIRFQVELVKRYLDGIDRQVEVARVTAPPRGDPLGLSPN